MQKLKDLYTAHTETVWGIVGVIGLILIVIGAKALMNGGPKDVVETETPTEIVQEQTASKVYVAPKKEVVEAKLSYSDALKAYGDRRIQFGENCNATPSQNVYKNGTKIMLDNRSASAKVFTVGGSPVSIGSYDYAVITLSYTNLPQTVLIDCGINQNPASVVVQQ